MVACHCIGKKGAGLRKGARRWARQTTRGGLCEIDIACFAHSFHERHPQMRGDGARMDALVSAAIARDERERDEPPVRLRERSEEHTSELQSLMRNSYAVFCLKKKTKKDSHRVM